MNSLIKNLQQHIVKKGSGSLFLRYSRFSTARIDEKLPNLEMPISKESLLKMRKETGYSYVKCRKALVKFGEENYSEALQWIKEVAKKEGWEKAAKLSNRNATQGLFALISERNVAIIVELKCETDFVSKSSEFKDLIQKIASKLLDHSKKVNKIVNEIGKLYTIEISPNEIKLPEGRTLEELIVSYIGRMGENIKMNNAKIVFTDPSTEIIGHTHPKEEYENIQLGRYASFIALKREAKNSGFPTEKLGQQICHHIIGMLPEYLGSPPLVSLKNQENNNENSELETNEENEDEITHSKVTNIEENESQLLRQPFMFNPQQTIFDYLNYHGATVTDFIRMEFGRGTEND